MGPIILERQQPLSKSQLWTGQRSFYDQKGINAWTDEVPFYITSNPFIAHCYAELVIRFIQDWIKQHPELMSEPFYILELGTGSGQFSYYVIKKINQLLNQLNLSHVNFCYVMSDFTTRNVDFWKQHDALRPYVESKQLDFAIYDLENDTTIHLIENNITLARRTLNNPLIVFANYIFDTIKSDIFSIKNGKIKASLVTLKTQEKIDLHKSRINWKKIKIEFTEKPIQKNHYSSKIIDAVLQSYKEKLKDTQLLFPIGAINCINNLKKISNERLLLISSDKGFITLNELEALDYPELDVHGSFSLMVNYHAIGRYFKECHGDFFSQSPRDGLSTVVFSSGFHFNQLPETQNKLTQSVEGFSPTDYFIIYENILKIKEKASLDTLFSFLRLSYWDPFIFFEIEEQLTKKLKTADKDSVDYFVKNAPRLAENFYFIPKCDDIFFSLGLIHYELDKYKEAIDYYLKSENYFESCFQSSYNIGLCYYYGKQHKTAIHYFEKALKFKPKSQSVKALLAKAKTKYKSKKTKPNHGSIYAKDTNLHLNSFSDKLS